MNKRSIQILFAAGILAGGVTALSFQQTPNAGPAEPQRPGDAIQGAQKPDAAPVTRPEQRKSTHDSSATFGFAGAQPSSPVFRDQPKEGRISGFDFYRDPLNADRPFMPFEEILKKESANKPAVMKAQRVLLESRYNLAPRFYPEAKMSRGKPLTVGPTAKLAQGITWDQLGQMRPDEIRQRSLFPYGSLPHPLQVNGGQVFPKMQIDMFPRLERFDVDFDLPDPFLPEFPPAIFLTNRPELGDVSRGEVVSINNYYLPHNIIG